MYKEHIQNKYPKEEIELGPVYHGTNEDVALKLCQKNFNRSYTTVGQSLSFINNILNKYNFFLVS